MNIFIGILWLISCLSWVRATVYSIAAQEFKFTIPSIIMAIVSGALSMSYFIGG